MTGGGTLPVVLLGIIAGATLVMAVIQVAVVAFAARQVRRVDALIASLDSEVRPVIATAAAAATHASRAAALAAAQVERADRVLGDLSARIDGTAAALQHGLLAPAREGRALMAGVQATVAALLASGHPPRPHRRGQDEDPLFIG